MRKLLLITCFLVLKCAFANAQTTQKDRTFWLQELDKVARPVMYNLAHDQLKEKMPVILSTHIDNPDERRKVSYLEAFGRTLSGIAPWLESEGGTPQEQNLREQYRKWALSAVQNAVNPAAKDYLEWQGGQPLVDASFFALALIRSPYLWHHLNTKVQKQVVDALLQTRQTIPVYSNWILFSGMIEAFFCKYDLPYDPVRIEYGIQEFSEHWYVGDGFFSDGMNFHLDYYNSYVIQPYLNTILQVIAEKHQNRYDAFIAKFKKISQRYAEIQERQINTDGSFPIVGRSIVYRGGAFQHLADMALRKALPSSLTEAQVRCALTAVIKRTLEVPKTFTDDGWLNIGLSGHQPDLADFYITTGSSYLCTEIFLPLGLSADDTFWTSAPQSWSSVKIWGGQDVPADHALDIH